MITSKVDYNLRANHWLKFLRVERLLVVDFDRCPTAGLAKGGYYCRVRRMGDDKIIKEYGFVVR